MVADERNETHADGPPVPRDREREPLAERGDVRPDDLDVIEDVGQVDG